LLKVHISYGPLVQALLKKFNPVAQASGLCKKRMCKHRPEACATVKAFAHITGGGFVDNIPRVLPKNLDVVIRKGSWDMLPIFKIIESKSGVPDAELYQVFNMGVGMVSIVSADKADAVLKFIRASTLRSAATEDGQKHKAWLIGEVVKGQGEARVI
jgi:phosphoribosylformylglycinamidine cyclo-ligase